MDILYATVEPSTSVRMPTTPDGVDQLRNVIETIKSDPYGRRHVISLWNPETIGKSVLPLSRRDDSVLRVHVRELSCVMYQRSVDAFRPSVQHHVLRGLDVHDRPSLRSTSRDMKIDMGDTSIRRMQTL
jgi:hypothetical protein